MSEALDNLPDDQAIAQIYTEDSVLQTLTATAIAAEAAAAKARDLVHDLDTQKRAARRMLDQQLGLFNRSRRRIKTRQRILVDRFMQDKVIRLRRKLGIRPQST